MSASATAAAATSPGVQRSSSSSRRVPNYSNPIQGQPHRSQSTNTRAISGASSSSKSSTQRTSYDRPVSQQQQTPLTNVLPHRDFETSNLPRPSAGRRSSSQDRPYDSQSQPTRHESVRNTQRTSSRPGQSRYAGEGPPPAITNGTSSSTARTSLDHAQIPSTTKGRRTTITGQSGTWSLGKTIGAGSMGKVKLAKKLDSGEQVAVKIVPRHTTDDGHHHSSKDRERQDHSKEVRTAREAAIVSLLDHPYICAMRDVVRTNFHWYMLFEYVNGGQMLDYIISHGRLKEKQARKFGRQIASALDYCHRNSIVHRDLKIENILISKTGDIKIIDFGLSNLFSPRNQLKTFCGSLYFAAPELLQAKQYTGPEVDVWSFGIVLYVLVCGKVPFDDQSMPQLHAKIKRGVVDYPVWLSVECRNLISRMLVTEPRNRATLHEIMNHPWITKGFNTPPDNYLPPREPLQLPLDPAVIQGMTGFDFGAPELISSQLTKVLESDEYQTALRNAKDIHSQSLNAEKKRSFPSFDFYKRRNSASRDTLTNPSAEAIHLGLDPVNAFSPLISIYNLVKEKQERARHEENPGAMSMPRSPDERPLKVPDLPAPEAAYTNSTSYEIPGETATGGRSRPRARTHGEDEVVDGMQNLNIKSSQAMPATPPLEQLPARKESAAAGLLRRFSTRRHRAPDHERPQNQQTPMVSVQPPVDSSSTPRKSFSIRKPRDRAREGYSVGNLHAGRSQPAHDELLTPPGSAEARGTKGLGRSASVNSAEARRRQNRVMSEGPPSRFLNEPPMTSGSDRSSVSGQIPRPSVTSAPDSELKSSPSSRSAAARTKSLGHARRESIQARRAKREEAIREANVPEETDQELSEEKRVDSTEHVKPVFLKGLFSVSTTSTKPVAAIRADIVRVLKQLGVDYTEIRGGFSCTHSPSIDLNKVVDEAPQNSGTNQTPAHKRRISFGGFMGGSEKDEFRKGQQDLKGRAETSQTNSDMSDESLERGDRGNRAVGETTTHVQSELGGSMILHFEILIVKVPILSLHGIQFKRLSGGTWQYKNMAEKILKQLRL